jgi:hypothetical protein
MEKFSRRRNKTRPISRGEAVPLVRKELRNDESVFTLRSWLSELDAFAQKFEYPEPYIKQAGIVTNRTNSTTEDIEDTTTLQPTATLVKGNSLFSSNRTDQFNMSSSKFEPNTRLAQRNSLITPQADLGIGPVQYNIQFPPEGGIAERPLAYLNRLVELEKELGDYTIKFEATLLCIVFGVEDPLSWLPSAQRLAIRSATRR